MRNLSPCQCGQPLVGKDGMLTPNPDIAGLGVLVGLMVPAVSVFILIVLYYFFAVKATNRTMCTRLDQSFLDWVRHGKARNDPTDLPRAVHDQSVPSEVQHLKGKFRWRMDPEALEKIILSFSDAQLVNAFSLLLSEFTLGCKIDAYHWQVLVQCVWFASATHLAAIPILKAQLQEAKGHVSLYVRALLMTLVLAMLVASLIPTGHPLWLLSTLQHMTEGTTRPALCFFDYGFLPETGIYAVETSGFGIIWLGWSIGLVTTTYARRIYELISPLSPAALEAQQDLLDRPLSPGYMKKLGHAARFRRRLAYAAAWVASFRKGHLANFVNNMNEKTENKWLTGFLWSGLREVSTTIWRLLESFIWHIVWLLMMMLWNMYLLIYNKWYFNSAIGEGGQGDQAWGFGQSMPLIILILPLVTIIDVICDAEPREPLGEKFLWKEWVPFPPAEQRPSAEPTNDTKPAIDTVTSGKGIPKDSESTRITMFLIFEFALLFGLLATVNFIATVKTAGTYAGTTYLFLFLLCLVSAPLVFTYTIRLHDVFFIRISEEKVYKNMWLRSTVALIVALAIGAGVSYYFLHPFIEDLGAISPLLGLYSQGLNADCFYWNTKSEDLWISSAPACSESIFGPLGLANVNPTCFRHNQTATSNTTWISEICLLEQVYGET